MEELNSGLRGPISVFDPERPSGLRAACRVLPPALLHRLIVLAGARTRIGRLRVPIALEKEAEAIVVPVVAARNGDIDRRPTHGSSETMIEDRGNAVGAMRSSTSCGMVMRSSASLASSPLSIVTAVQRRPAWLRAIAVNTCEGASIARERPPMIQTQSNGLRTAASLDTFEILV